MGSNTFGTLFKMTTWGESHGKVIGVVIDGCPAGLPIDEEMINKALAVRAPGKSPFTSPRNEPDHAEILSGVFQGKTTGTPISIIIPNRDADPSKYESTKNVLKPGHAHFTYLEKYGVFDYRGGGRASARETACRVAAGAIAKKLLEHWGIEIVAYLKKVGHIEATIDSEKKEKIPFLNQEMVALLEKTKTAGDSIGGVVEFIATSVPVGLGDPVYEKLEAKLASAMLSLPATKGFELGEGFGAATMAGSEHNDLFHYDETVKTTTNHSGGTLGGISTGMPIIGRVAFKPASSIMKPQESLNLLNEKAVFQLPEGSRHDPCVAIRAVPVVEAMVALVLADALLLNRHAKL